MREAKIFEVGPRDGLQNEKVFVETDVKIELINRLSDAGLKKIEVTSFVSPKWVPQMADAKEVVAGIERKKGVTYSALTPNEKGMCAAIDAGMTEVAIFAAASESFSQKNINCSIEESLDRFAPVMELAYDNDIDVRGYVSCITHCPYEGEVPPSAVIQVSEALLDMGCYEVSLGDTIGKATPPDIKKLIAEHLGSVSLNSLALHLHDTFGNALSNVLMGLEMGIDTFDASVGGLGGCPYAEGASGNVATEKVVALLHENNISTGIDLEKLNDTARFILDRIQK